MKPNEFYSDQFDIPGMKGVNDDVLTDMEGVPLLIQSFEWDRVHTKGRGADSVFTWEIWFYLFNGETIKYNEYNLLPQHSMPNEHHPGRWRYKWVPPHVYEMWCAWVMDELQRRKELQRD